MTHRVPCEFRGRRWIFFAVAIVFGALALFCLTAGPLYLTGMLKDVRNRPRPDAGLGILLTGIPTAAICAAAVLNILVRREPLLRLFREGIELRRLGSADLDAAPIPPLARVVCSLVSFNALRQHRYRAEWSQLDEALVLGLPGMRVLKLKGDFHEVGDGSDGLYPALEAATLSDYELAAPPAEVAAAIDFYRGRTETGDLPSWQPAATPA
jgi:hypothetical protein